jgi:hypothetical protein
MPIITASDLVSQTSPDVQWLVPNLLLLHGLNLLAGEVAAGKTFLALDLALGVAARGEAWGGLPVPHGLVLYYCQDSSPELIGQRIFTLCRGYDIAPPDLLHFDFEPHIFAGGAQSLQGHTASASDPADLSDLADRIHSNGYILVILDVLVRYLPKMTDNNTASVGSMLAGLRSLSSNTTFLLVHHFNKQRSSHSRRDMEWYPSTHGDRIRGSSDIFASMDAVLTLTRRGTTRTLSSLKNRSGSDQARLTFTINTGVGSTPPLSAPTLPTGTHGVAAAGTQSECAQEGIQLIFSTGTQSGDQQEEDEDQEVEYTTIIVPMVMNIITILYSMKGTYFSRADLEGIIKEAKPLPSARTMDRVFARLVTLPQVTTAFHGHTKYYAVPKKKEREEQKADQQQAKKEGGQGGEEQKADKESASQPELF